MTTKKREKLFYKEISSKIKGSCFDVYKKFGGALEEHIINKALILELKRRGLKVETQKRIPVISQGEKAKAYAHDIIVEGKILIELKVKSCLTKEDERQFWYHLRDSDRILGFLINFGSKKLEIKRHTYNKDSRKHESICAILRANTHLFASACRGFSLIELIVAVTIFATLMIISSSIIVSSMTGQRTILSSQKIIDETSYALEYMGRAIRMSQKELDCDDHDSPSTCSCLKQNGFGYNYEETVLRNGIRFINDDGVCQEFFLENSQIKEIKNSDDALDAIALTSSKIKISNFGFNFSGESQGSADALDNLQPQATVYFTVGAEEEKEIKVQMTLSQRNLDVFTVGP